MNSSAGPPHPTPRPHRKDDVGVWAEPGQRRNAEHISDTLGVRLLTDPDEAGTVLYVDRRGTLSVLYGPVRRRVRMTIDLVHGPESRRWLEPDAKAPIVRAAGIDRGVESVCDATAGLGRDAFTLANLGCTVTAIERDPIVATLLDDGLRRAREHRGTRPVAERVRLIRGDAIEVLANLEVDAVYLDPMLPATGKGARVKKEMRFLQEHLGPDEDLDELLAAARRAATRRVVVKRPLKAAALGEPSTSIRSARSRWDVYLAG